MPYCFFSKGLTHDFSNKMEILSLFVSGQNGPGNNVLMIIEVENKPSYTINIWILHRCHIGFFSKGLTHDFSKKMEILSLFVSGQNGPGNNVLMIIEVENKPS